MYNVENRYRYWIKIDAMLHVERLPDDKAGMLIVTPMFLVSVIGNVGVAWGCMYLRMAWCSISDWHAYSRKSL